MSDSFEGRRVRGLLMGFSLLLLPVGASDEAATGIQNLKPVSAPAEIGSGEPNLTVGVNGQVFLSWIEPVDHSRNALRFSLYEKDHWKDPQTVVEGDNWFVNWADFPSLVAFEDDSLAAHWLVKSSEETYAYDIQIAFSADGGKEWSEPFTPHRDGTKTEHGFVSLLPWEKNQLAVAWLDGRNYVEEKNGEEPRKEMTVRYGRMDRDGQLFDEVELDKRACDCCQTAISQTPHGIIVAYRDRSEGEIRDIATVRLHRGIWSEPRTLFPDGWEIFGCPVNGPAIASRNEGVAIAWYTAAQGNSRVNVVFSKDEGATFGLPVRVDDFNPLGRVDVEMLDDGSVLVSWMEMLLDHEEIRVRRVHPNGSKSPSMTIARSSRMRAAGFPRMASQNGRVYFAWTEVGEKTMVRTAVGELSFGK